MKRKQPPVRGDIEDLDLSRACQTEEEVPDEEIEVVAAAAGPKKTYHKSPIISWTRRRDGPAFDMKEFLENVKKGFVELSNPRNHNQVKVVSLLPTHVQCMALWSKDYGPFIEAWKASETHDLLAQYDSYLFNFTLNGDWGTLLEPGLRTSLAQRLEQLRWLVDNFSAKNVVLRFDPIVVYYILGDNFSEPPRDNLTNFNEIATAAATLGIRNISIAFCNDYSQVVTRLLKHNIKLAPMDKEKRYVVMRRMMVTTDPLKIKLCACSQPELLECEGTGRSKCIDGSLINQLLDYKKKPLLAKPNLREKGTSHGGTEGCQCTKSEEIGKYDPCPHGCLYCYGHPANVPNYKIQMEAAQKVVVVVAAPPQP
jgi:hypothetical protein